MLASALIVFREVIEAALIVSIIMAATRQVAGRTRWVGLGVVLGLGGSFTVAAFANIIANSCDGDGQEISNALILLCAVALISWHVVWMNSHGRKLATDMRAIGQDVASGTRHMRILALVIGLAVMREGSEIVLMLQGLTSGNSQSPMSVYGGAVLGFGAGLLLSTLIYCGLLVLPIGRVFAVTNGFLILIAAGMAARAANLLMQAGLLSSLGGRVWDTRQLISESSLAGQILAALTGYMANPDGLEVLCYVATVTVILTFMTQTRPKIKITA